MIFLFRPSLPFFTTISYFKKEPPYSCSLSSSYPKRSESPSWEASLISCSILSSNFLLFIALVIRDISLCSESSVSASPTVALVDGLFLLFLPFMTRSGTRNSFSSFSSFLWLAISSSNVSDLWNFGFKDCDESSLSSSFESLRLNSNWRT